MEVLFGTCMNLTWLRELLREMDVEERPLPATVCTESPVVPRYITSPRGNPPLPRYLLVSPFASHVDLCPLALLASAHSTLGAQAPGV